MGRSALPGWLAVVGCVLGVLAVIAGSVAMVRVNPPGGDLLLNGNDGPVAQRVVLPIYFVGETNRGPRLVREDQEVVVDGSDLAAAAVDRAINGKPSDIAYRALLRGYKVKRTSFTGGALQVDLLSGGVQKDESPDATIAIQALVYTALRASGTQSAVRFTVDGGDVKSLLGQPLDGPVAALPEPRVMAPLSITHPSADDAMPSTFSVTGSSMLTNAQVDWVVYQDGQLVTSGTTMTVGCCAPTTFEFEVDGLSPGNYTVSVTARDTEAAGSGIDAATTKFVVGD